MHDRSDNYWERLSLKRANRRRALELMGGATALVGATSFLAACGGDGSTPAGTAGAATSQPSTAGTQSAKTGGVIKQWLLTNPPTFDAHQTTTYSTIWPAAAVFNKLIKFDPGKATDGPTDIVADLSTKWEQPDNSTLVFTLRQGVKFHDGTDFSSADVKAQFDWLLKPPSGKTFSRRGTLSAVESVEAPDATTVRIRLKQPNPSLLMNLATTSFVIGQAKDIAANGEISPSFVGTGPFKLKSYKSGSSIELERNPSYFVSGRPYLDGLIYYVVPEYSSALANFIGGQYQIFYDPTGRFAGDKPQVQQAMGDRVTFHNPPTFGRMVVFPNSRRTPFGDARVRKAINLAIDRQGLIKLVLQGNGFEGGYMSPKGIWGLTESDLTKIEGWGKPDPAAAMQLLSAAGVSTPLSITMTTRTDYQPQAEYVQDQLRKIGIEVKLNLADVASATPAVQKGDFDITIWNLAMPIDDPDTIFGEYATKNAARNYSAVYDEEVDKLFTKQSQELNVDVRKQIVHDLDKRALSLYQNDIMSYFVSNFVTLKSVQNLTIHPSNFTSNDFESVWLSS